MTGGRRTWRHATREVRALEDALNRKTRERIIAVCEAANRPVPMGIKRACAGLGTPAEQLFRRSVEMLTINVAPEQAAAFARATGEDVAARVLDYAASRPARAAA